MIKKSVLFFLCFTLFLSIPGCKKKLPTQPDIPTKVLPTIEYFIATPEAISPGESSILSWSTKNATNVKINRGVGTVSATGTKEVSPEETTTYTLTAINSDGQKTASCKVEVTEVVHNPPTIEYFTAVPDSIYLGEYSTLSWSVINATTLMMENSFEPGIPVPLVGTQSVSPIETTTYTLTATNDDGETTAFCTVEVYEPSDYEGTWSGSYVVTACSATYDFGSVGWCDAMGPGTELPIALILTQNVDQVIGLLYLGLIEGNVDGTIAIDGQLLLTGFSQVEVEGVWFTIDSTLQLQSTVPGQITGTLVWTFAAEGFLLGSVQVSGDIVTLSRTSTMTTGLTSSAPRLQTLEDLIRALIRR